MHVQCSAHTGRQWLTPTTTPDQYSALPDHHPFYQYIYRSSLSRYARVALALLASHGPWLIACTEQELAMIKSSQNVHYIEQSNLWVGKAQGMCARARMRIAHYRVMYIIPRFSFASGTEAS